MKKFLNLSIIAAASLISISSYAQNSTNNNARNIISNGNTNTTTTTTTTTTVQQQVQQQGTTNTSTNATTGSTPVSGNTSNATPSVLPVQNRATTQNGSVSTPPQPNAVQNGEPEGNFEANPVTSTPTTVVPEVNTNNSFIIDNQNKRPNVTNVQSVPTEKKQKVKTQNKKPVKNNTVDSITLEAPSRSNGIITSSDVYHLSPSQTYRLLPEQVSANILINNNELTYNVYNNTNNESLSSYNFNNLPGLDGQFHLLLIRSDLSKTYGQTFNFSPDSTIDKVKVNLPKKFTSSSKNTCDAIILSYQLKNSNEVTNIVNFVQYNTGDNNESYILTPTKPQNCNLALPELQATFTITNNHLVNISTNPKLASEPNKLGLTAHSTESGRLELLKAEQTILISTDFSSVRFLVPQTQKGTTDAMKSFYGLQYSSNSIASNDYLVGISFLDKEKQEWAWGKINVK